MPVADEFTDLMEPVERALKALNEASARFGNVDRLTLRQGFVMGCIRSSISVVQTAYEFIQQAQAVQDAKKK